MPKLENTLAIETSCDDTSVAIVRADGFVLCCLSAAQDAQHKPFGGIVPEVAGRAHAETLVPLIEKVLAKAKMTWPQIDSLSVTSRPGLLGSLLVGVVTAKTLGLVFKKPFLGVNHLEGHIFAPFLSDSEFKPKVKLKFPFVSLAVSGGHTSLYNVEGLGRYQTLGTTRDDAAGEAFDKFGKMLGLGFPGGVAVDRLSAGGDVKAFHFPQGMMQEGELAFSYSGVKASSMRLIASLSVEEKRARISDLCASFQEQLAEGLVEKLDRALKKTQTDLVTLTGGVSANSALRRLTIEWANKRGVELLVPPLRYCTDNAAMIGFAGLLRMNRGEFDNQKLAPSPESGVDVGIN